MGKYQLLADKLKQAGKVYRPVTLLKPTETPYGFAIVQLKRDLTQADTRKLLAEDEIVEFLFKAQDAEKIFEQQVKLRGRPIYKQVITLALTKDEYNQMKAKEV